MNAAAFAQICSHIALFMLAAAFLLITIRIVRGPALPDRVLALDMLVTVAVGFIATISIAAGEFLYLDVAIALALVGFLSTVALARFVLTHGGSRARADFGDEPDDADAAESATTSGDQAGRQAKGEAAP
ncbi:cation:proton antiporter [Segnochrobactrum spirostomi]|uniref:Cation:proton antiporter n=1 Tax=Segnochrobactrum spirostomi TaxID=2608987 RepID=A0A6A7Y0F4_9HYPH|nr:cation:proton antiporter [Segnochrobactrum spirostomi]MQT12343.1 cation:proton antiporter [Segnochrobactrum spirostomi]